MLSSLHAGVSAARHRPGRLAQVQSGMRIARTDDPRRIAGPDPQRRERRDRDREEGTETETPKGLTPDAHRLRTRHRAFPALNRVRRARPAADRSFASRSAKLVQAGVPE